MTDRIPLPDSEETRRCSECREVKPIEAFHRGGKRGRKHCCAVCLSARRAGTHTRWKSPEIRRRQKLSYEYGITEEQYDRMLAAQGGRCAICQEEPNGGKLFVDHCHSTKAVRGLLCVGCNTLLGGYERMKELAPAYLAVYGNGHPVLRSE